MHRCTTKIQSDSVHITLDKRYREYITAPMDAGFKALTTENTRDGEAVIYKDQ